MNEGLHRLLHTRQSPNRRPAMHQKWDDLLFLHWRYNADELAKHLPPMLTLDLYEDQAYISIVAFRMNSVRPAGLPALAWLSYFNELNVRVYVRDDSGEPGVYFLSLDCNRAPAVWMARAFFSLPYKHAAMSFCAFHDEKDGEARTFSMTCQRIGQIDTAVYRWRPNSLQQPTEPGSLEFFLTERYNFFTIRRGVLMRGQVYHAPYDVGPAELHEWSFAPLEWNGLSLEARSPYLVLCSAGVTVEAFSLVPA